MSEVISELLTTENILSFGGASMLIALIIQLIKSQIADWRWTNIVAMLVGLVIIMLATGIVKGYTPQTILDGVLLAFVAGMTASGMYETTVNVLSLAGKGPRAKA